MYRIRKAFEFAAAHLLPEHDGKCANPHGHNYRVEVVLTGPAMQGAGPKIGMLRDFADLDTIVKPLIDMLDHSDLNVTWPGVIDDYDLVMPSTTTAEGLATGIYTIVALGLASLPGYTYEARVLSVRVWETPKSWAEFAA